jgi:hypothetical protein
VCIQICFGCTVQAIVVVFLKMCFIQQCMRRRSCYCLCTFMFYLYSTCHVGLVPVCVHIAFIIQYKECRHRYCVYTPTCMLYLFSKMSGGFVLACTQCVKLWRSRFCVCIDIYSIYTVQGLPVSFPRVRT